MAMSDPIADLLTRLRNAIQAGHATAAVPASAIKAEICRVLKEEGFIEDFSVSSDAQPVIQVTLKYLPDRSSVLKGLRRVSKPSLRVYTGSRALKPVRSGLGVSILSTSKGVMTGRQARREQTGGEVLCEVW